MECFLLKRTSRISILCSRIGVKRQRNLRKLIGETISGASKLNFEDSVDWSDGRFAVIKVEDRNLPMIASKRVIKPRSAAAKQELDAAFEATANIRKEVMDTLLANEYDREMFHLIYPFSPALMETLIAASSMLQRERVRSARRRRVSRCRNRQAMSRPIRRWARAVRPPRRPPGVRRQTALFGASRQTP